MQPIDFLFWLAATAALGFVFGWKHGRVNGFNKANVDHRRAVAAETAEANAKAVAQAHAEAEAAALHMPVAIGERFVYMDIEMLCLSYKLPTSGGWIPGLAAEFSTEAGDMRRWIWNMEEVPALTLELKRTAQAEVPA